LGAVHFTTGEDCDEALKIFRQLSSFGEFPVPFDRWTYRLHFTCQGNSTLRCNFPLDVLVSVFEKKFHWTVYSDVLNVFDALLSDMAEQNARFLEFILLTFDCTALIEHICPLVGNRFLEFNVTTILAIIRTIVCKHPSSHLMYSQWMDEVLKISLLKFPPKLWNMFAADLLEIISPLFISKPQLMRVILWMRRLTTVTADEAIFGQCCNFFKTVFVMNFSSIVHAPSAIQSLSPNIPLSQHQRIKFQHTSVWSLRDLNLVLKLIRDNSSSEPISEACSLVLSKFHRRNSKTRRIFNELKVYNDIIRAWINFRQNPGIIHALRRIQKTPSK
jgi:hypothetical protein